MGFGLALGIATGNPALGIALDVIERETERTRKQAEDNAKKQIENNKKKK